MTSFNKLGYQDWTIFDNKVNGLDVKTIVDPMGMSIRHVIQDNSDHTHYICESCKQSTPKVLSHFEGLYEYCPDCWERDFSSLDIIVERNKMW